MSNIVPDCGFPAATSIRRVRELISGAHFSLVANEQFYLVIGVPLLFNATFLGILMAWVNSKFETTDARIAALDAKFEGRFAAMDARFSAIEKRFDDMRDLWRAELHRVEEILDARLKHLKERH